MNLESVESMYEEIRSLGERYDRNEQAEALVADFEAKLAEIEAEIDDQESPKVLILFRSSGKLFSCNGEFLCR